MKETLSDDTFVKLESNHKIFHMYINSSGQDRDELVNLRMSNYPYLLYIYQFVNKRLCINGKILRKEINEK